MQRKDQKKKNKDAALKPSVFYKPAMYLFGLYLKAFRRLRVDRSGIRDIKPPYVIVSNHQSMFDFGAVAFVCIKHPPIFVVSTHFFRNKVFRIGLRLGGCIPKRQFFPDLSSVRKMIRVIRSGRSIAIFPEGQISSIGESAEIDPSIGKLVKNLGVPVVNVQIRGNHLYSPKWACGNTFPTKAEAKGYVLLTSEDVEKMSDAEIAERISQGVFYNDYEWQRTAMHKSSRPRNLQGLENLLWLCPKCGKEHTMQSSGRDLFCSSCGYRVSTDDYGFLFNPDGSRAEMDTPPEWFRWQDSVLDRRLVSGELLPIQLSGRFLESSVEDFSENGYRCHGEGTVTLDRDGLHLDVTRDGEPFKYDVSPAITFNLTHSEVLCAFDIPGNSKEDRDFAFDPEDSRDMMKFIQAWSVLRRRYYS